MIVCAPASRAPAMAASPTPPQPNTATESPRPTSPVSMAAPSPAITPQPSSPATSGFTSDDTLVHCPAATSVFSAKAPMPSAGDSSTPSSVIFCVALWVEKQYQGRPRRHDRHSPHTARQFRITKSPGATSATSGPTASTTPGRLVAEQEREVVVDAALAVVEVGVAHAARLHLHERLTGAGIGDDDRLDGDGLLLRRATTPRTSCAMGGNVARHPACRRRLGSVGRDEGPPQLHRPARRCPPSWPRSRSWP